MTPRPRKPAPAVEVTLPVPVIEPPITIYAKGFFARVIVAVVGPNGGVEEAAVIAFVPRCAIPVEYMGLEYDCTLRPELDLPPGFRSIAEGT